MNKVIKGKRYDTDTAEELGVIGANRANSLTRWENRLYRKRTGEFFLYCYGGAASQYAVSAGIDGYSCGEEIHPMTQEKAEKWVEENLSGDEYEKIFGVKEEGEKTRITVYVSPAIADKAKRLAVERKISLSEMIERLIDNF